MRHFKNQAIPHFYAISADISDLCGEYAPFLKLCAPPQILRPFLDYAGFSAIAESRFSGGTVGAAWV